MSEGLRLFKIMAPGVLAGIQNVDACAILCLLSIGAAYRYSLLWAVVLGFLLYTFILQVASEVALVTGKGLAENMKERFSEKHVSLTVFTSVAANISLISAELAGMAIALSALFNLSLVTAAIVSALILLAVACTRSLDLIDEVLIALSLTFIAYVILAFAANPNPLKVVEGFIKPAATFDGGYWIAVLAVMGMAVGPNVLFYEASDLAEKGVKENSLIQAMLSAVVGSLISLAICIAIVVCGAGLGTVSENMIEAIEAFKQVFGEASIFLFSLGLFAGSLLAAVITLHSTVALLSETYGWRGVGPKRDNKVWPIWVAVITIASVLPLILITKPVKVAIVSSVLSSLATVPPFVLLAKLCCDSRIMKGFEIKGYMKVVAWLIVAFFSIINLGGLLLVLYDRPILGYVTLPLDLLVLLVGASAIPLVLKGLSLMKEGYRKCEGGSFEY